MDAIWQALIANLAVVALFSVAWSQTAAWFDGRRWLVRKAATGIMAGLAAISTMMLSVELAPGLAYDLRTCIIAVAAFFAGPLTAAVAVAMAGAYRVLEGGMGVPAGLLHMGAAALVGLGVRAASRSAASRPLYLVVLALAMTALLVLMLVLLAGVLQLHSLWNLLLPGAALTFLATLFMGINILAARKIGRDRAVLDAVLAQAPGFLFVKDAQGRYLAANAGFARYYGHSGPAGVLGKTDRELAVSERADRFTAEDERILRTGAPLLDIENVETDADGGRHWYTTSKVPLTDPDGHIIGLAGVTVETTRLRQLEQEVSESRDRLELALAEMSDGLALFDAGGYLVFCNDQYRTAFPRSAHVREPGVHINDILLECARQDEQLGIPQDDIEGWARHVGSLLRVPNVVTIEVFDGRYLQLRSRPAPQ